MDARPRRFEDGSIAEFFVHRARGAGSTLEAVARCGHHILDRLSARRPARRPGLGSNARRSGPTCQHHRRPARSHWVLSQTWNRGRREDGEASMQRGCRTARRGRDVGLKAYLAWCLRIMAIISMPHRNRRPCAGAWDAWLFAGPPILDQPCKERLPTNFDHQVAAASAAAGSFCRMTAGRTFLSMSAPSTAPASAISGKAKRSASSWSRTPARARCPQSSSRPSETGPFGGDHTAADSGILPAAFSFGLASAEG